MENTVPDKKRYYINRENNNVHCKKRCALCECFVAIVLLVKPSSFIRWPCVLPVCIVHR